MIPWIAVALADPHQDRFAEARSAEGEGRLEDAIALCREVITLAPQGPRTPTCERRIVYLEARRDPDGTFATWSALESVRRRWRTGDPDALAAEVAALSGPTSPAVGAEVAIWLARDALSRRDDPAAALAATEAAYADEALAEEEALWRQVVELRAVALARLGDVAAARQVEAAVRVPAAPGAERPTPVDQVVIDRRRLRLAVASVAGVVAFVALAGPLAWRGLRHRPVPAGLVPLGLAGVGAGLIAVGWDPAAAPGVPRMVVGLALVHVLALGALVAARERPWLRRAVRVAAAVASLAAGYLALWSTGTLPWVGL